MSDHIGQDNHSDTDSGVQEQRWRQFVQQESIAHYSDMRNDIFVGRKESSIGEYVAHTKCTHTYRNKGIHISCLGIVSCELVAHPYSNLTIHLVIYANTFAYHISSYSAGSTVTWHA